MPAGSILVADDDAAIRTVLNQALSRAGYEVRSTGNAATLWRWVSQGEGDLVITDVVMPDENAFDLLPRIKKLRPHLPVVIMSAISLSARCGIVIKDAAVNEFPGQGGGFLGRGFDPLRIETAADKKSLRLPDIVLPPDITPSRLAERRLLQTAFNSSSAIAGQRADAADLDANYARALDLLRSPGVHKAFDLAAEPAAIRAAYGEHLFGQGCLLGRRLLEAGVGLVTVYWHYEGPDDSPVWDTHENNFPHLRQRLVPPADAAIAAVLRDLSDRGLLGETVVVVLGEFGRSPKVNGKGGRDHWPHAQSILLAGAGIQGGSIYGSTDPQGGYPATSPVTPRDFTATLLHLLGVPADLVIRDRAGRPYRACEGTPVSGLIT